MGTIRRKLVKSRIYLSYLSFLGALEQGLSKTRHGDTARHGEPVSKTRRRHGEIENRHFLNFNVSHDHFNTFHITKDPFQTNQQSFNNIGEEKISFSHKGGPFGEKYFLSRIPTKCLLLSSPWSVMQVQTVFPHAGCRYCRRRDLRRALFT